jgi:hypothetical protein
MTTNHSAVSAAGGDGYQRQPRSFDVDRTVGQNWRSPVPLLAVRFPSMRAEALDFLDLISDPAQTARAWVDHDPNDGLLKGGWLPPHVLNHLDDCLGFQDPEQMVGLTLRTDEETVLVRALGRVIDSVPIQASDSDTVSTPEWLDLRTFAHNLASAMRGGDARAPLNRAAAQLTLDHIDSDSLPILGTDALVAGLDTPHLREAAGARPDDRREPRFLFERALYELGIDLPHSADAIDTLLFDALVEMAIGRRNPIEVAHWIWRTMYGLVEREGDLRIFIGLASEHDDHPSAHQEIADAIVDAANDILSRGYLRQWLCLQAREHESPLTLTSMEGGHRVAIGGLDVTTELQQRILAWASQFEDAQRRRGRGPSNFKSVKAAEEFVADGEHLRLDLQAQLGPSWHVEYMPTARAFQHASASDSLFRRRMRAIGRATRRTTRW